MSFNDLSLKLTKPEKKFLSPLLAVAETCTKTASLKMRHFSGMQLAVP
jgi:hypothetical protein